MSYYKNNRSIKLLKMKKEKEKDEKYKKSGWTVLARSCTCENLLRKPIILLERTVQSN